MGFFCKKNMTQITAYLSILPLHIALHFRENNKNKEQVKYFVSFRFKTNVSIFSRIEN